MSDKRRNLRIQGGWNTKIHSNRKKSDKVENGSYAPVVNNTEKYQFDPSVASQNLLQKECKIIEISGATDKEISYNKQGVAARIRLIPDYIKPNDSSRLFKYLSENIPWTRRENRTPNGKVFREPRKTYWYGKPYNYSAVGWGEQNDWDPEINKLKNRLNHDETIILDHHNPNVSPFDSVMCNYYENHADSIAWHSDNEPSLGKFPCIASISLGATRVFELARRSEFLEAKRALDDGDGTADEVMSSQRPRDPKKAPFKGCTEVYRIPLPPGSLLIMEGSIQQDWVHRVPKEYHDKDARINLTYRMLINEVRIPSKSHE